MITLVHCKKHPFDIYIGRKNGKLQESKWKNPYIIGIHGNRDTVIMRYEGYIVRVPELMNSLHELHNMTLGCWCAPLDCHGRILRELFEKHVQVENGIVVSQDVFCDQCALPVDCISNGKPCCRNYHTVKE